MNNELAHLKSVSHSLLGVAEEIHTHKMCVRKIGVSGDIWNGEPLIQVRSLTAWANLLGKLKVIFKMSMYLECRKGIQSCSLWSCLFTRYIFIVIYLLYLWIIVFCSYYSILLNKCNTDVNFIKTTEFWTLSFIPKSGISCEVILILKRNVWGWQPWII
jgi:hypothetical protein